MIHFFLEKQAMNHQSNMVVGLSSPSLSQLTLQGVEDGEEVHERRVNGSPGEESEAPGESQQDGDPRHAAHVLHCGAVSGVVRVLPLDPAQLHQHHHEHDEVEDEDDAEVGHHGHVEGHVVLQPAAGDKEEAARVNGVRAAWIPASASSNCTDAHKSSLVPSANFP